MPRSQLTSRTRSRLVASTLLLGFALPAWPQVAPQGPEIVVTDLRDTTQRAPVVAQRNGGKDGFLLVWEDAREGVFARLLSPTGPPSAAAQALAVNDPLPPRPFYGQLEEAAQPAIAVKADSTFLLVWVELTVQRSLDIFVDQRSVLSTRLLARRFAANGQPLAGPAGNVQVIAGSAGLPLDPAVVATPDGGFWITWAEVGPKRGGIHLRRLDAANKLGKDLKIAARTPTGVASSLTVPAISLGGDGFAVVWEQCCDGADQRQVYARMFKANGAAVGPAFKVSSAAGRGAVRPAVAGRTGNNVLVVWESTANDGSGPALIRGQLIAKTGSLLQGERALSASTTAAHRAPQVAATADRGGWLVSWSVFEGFTRAKVEGRAFNANAGFQGRVFRYSQGVLTRNELDLGLAAAANGRAVVAWVGANATLDPGIRVRGAKGPVRK